MPRSFPVQFLECGLRPNLPSLSCARHEPAWGAWVEFPECLAFRDTYCILTTGSLARRCPAVSANTIQTDTRLINEVHFFLLNAVIHKPVPTFNLRPFVISLGRKIFQLFHEDKLVGQCRNDGCSFAVRLFGQSQAELLSVDLFFCETGLFIHDVCKCSNYLIINFLMSSWAVSVVSVNGGWWSRHYFALLQVDELTQCSPRFACVQILLTACRLCTRNDYSVLDSRLRNS